MAIRPDQTTTYGQIINTPNELLTYLSDPGFDRQLVVRDGKLIVLDKKVGIKTDANREHQKEITQKVKTILNENLKLIANNQKLKNLALNIKGLFDLNTIDNYPWLATTFTQFINELNKSRTNAQKKPDISSSSNDQIISPEVQALIKLKDDFIEVRTFILQLTENDMKEKIIETLNSMKTENTTYQNYALAVLSKRLNQEKGFHDLIELLNKKNITDCFNGNQAFFALAYILNQLKKYDSKSNFGLHELELCEKYKENPEGIKHYIYFKVVVDYLCNQPNNQNKLPTEYQEIVNLLKEWIKQLQQGCQQL